MVPPLLGRVSSRSIAIKQWIAKCDVFSFCKSRLASCGGLSTDLTPGFARMQPLQQRAFDMNESVTGMASMLRRTLGDHIELKVVLADNLWPVVADPSQIQDVLLNLAVNARDAMPDGGHLVIETAAVGLDENYAAHNPEVTPGDYVMLGVSDRNG
jgi:signal transduction histidine kinase